MAEVINISARVGEELTRLHHSQRSLRQLMVAGGGGAKANIVQFCFRLSSLLLDPMRCDKLYHKLKA